MKSSKYVFAPTTHAGFAPSSFDEGWDGHQRRRSRRAAVTVKTNLQSNIFALVVLFQNFD